jgi:hypothetical protein
MMNRILAGVRLFLAVQYRSGFIHVYLGVSLFTVAIVRVFLPEGWREILVPVLLLTEYGVVGVYLIAAQSYLARIENSTEALSVTPLRRGERIVAMVLAATLTAVGAALMFAIGVLGAEARVALLIAPLTASAVLAGAVGLVVASRYVEFTRFIVGSIPVSTVFALPLLSFFGLVPRYAFAWLPWDAALYAFAGIVGSDISVATYLLLSLQLLVFAALAVGWAVRVEDAA